MGLPPAPPGTPSGPSPQGRRPPPSLGNRSRSERPRDPPVLPCGPSAGRRGGSALPAPGRGGWSNSTRCGVPPATGGHTTPGEVYDLGQFVLRCRFQRLKGRSPDVPREAAALGAMDPRGGKPPSYVWARPSRGDELWAATSSRPRGQRFPPIGTGQFWCWQLHGNLQQGVFYLWGFFWKQIFLMTSSLQLPPSHPPSFLDGID